MRVSNQMALSKREVKFLLAGISIRAHTILCYHISVVSVRKKITASYVENVNIFLSVPSTRSQDFPIGT